MSHLDDKHILHYLFREYMFGKIFGREPKVYLASVEGDGRRRKKLRRELIEQGIITDAMTITSKVWDSQETKHVDIEETWNKLFESEHVDKKTLELGYVPRGCLLSPHWYGYSSDQTEEFSLGNYKSLIEQGVQWNYLDQYDRAIIKPNKSRSGDILSFTTPQLQESYKTKKRENEIKNSVGINLSWGLEKFTGLTVEESELYQDSPRRGSFRSFGKDPKEWEKKLEENISEATIKIKRLENQIFIHQKTQKEIRKIGGWRTFIELLTDNITTAFDKGELT